VDALSAPLFFGNSSAMNYSRGLIAAGAALPFIAQAQAPTVTLPRIKARFLLVLKDLPTQDKSHFLPSPPSSLFLLVNHYRR